MNDARDTRRIESTQMLLLVLYHVTKKQQRKQVEHKKKKRGQLFCVFSTTRRNTAILLHLTKVWRIAFHTVGRFDGLRFLIAVQIAGSVFKSHAVLHSVRKSTRWGLGVARFACHHLRGPVFLRGKALDRISHVLIPNRTVNFFPFFLVFNFGMF